MRRASLSAYWNTLLIATGADSVTATMLCVGSPDPLGAGVFSVPASLT